MLTIQAQNQITPISVPFVNSLCFTTSTSEGILFEDHIEIANLSIQDQLLIKEINYSHQHFEYFDDQGFPVEDKELMFHENLYPEWFIPASVYRSDVNGSTSIFTQMNDLISGGWAGATKSNSPVGVYKIDSQTGEKVHFIEHSLDSREAYNEYTETVRSLGFLENYVYPEPTQEVLNFLSNSGFSVTQTLDEIIAENLDLKMTWPNNDKIYLVEMFEHGVSLGKESNFYTYDNTFQQYLLKSTSVTITKSFSTGQDYMAYSIKLFEGYNETCSVPGNQVFRLANEKFVNEVTVKPNPCNDYTEIEFPYSDSKTKISLFDLTGKFLFIRNVDSADQNLRISTSDYPGGIYIVKVEQGEKLFTKKLIKQ